MLSLLKHVPPSLVGVNPSSGPKLSIYSRKGEPSGLEKWREKGSRMLYLEPK